MSVSYFFNTGHKKSLFISAAVNNIISVQLSSVKSLIIHGRFAECAKAACITFIQVDPFREKQFSQAAMLSFDFLPRIVSFVRIYMQFFIIARYLNVFEEVEGCFFAQD